MVFRVRKVLAGEFSIEKRTPDATNMVNANAYLNEVSPQNPRVDD